MSVTSPGLVSPIASVATESLKGAVSNNSEGEGKAAAEDDGAGGDKIEQKEFFWDQFLTYMATIIALLTVLDVTLQFFRGGGLSCRVPATERGNETIEPTRDEVSFVNTFCQQSLSRAEYFPLFVIIQGLLLAAPHYLWVSLFAGQIDFFFGLVRQLDRLRDNKTGQYRSENFEIVDKLEKHFPQKWSVLSIFSLYVAKLAIQFVVVFISIIMNGALFRAEDFSFTFKCPRDFDASSPPEGWWLSFDVVCVFTSFRLHRTIQNFNYLLLSLAFVAVLYGLMWCVTRHAKVLGYRDIALFAFNSCLRPEDYVHSDFFKPRIMNDLDFLMMRLFQADSGCGNVFKDIQVERELRKEVRKDHEYLYLLLNAIKDSERTRNDERLKKQGSDKTGDTPSGSADSASQVQPAQVQPAQVQPAQIQPAQGAEVVERKEETEDISRTEDIANLYGRFLKAKFSTNPGKSAYALLGKQTLGSVTWSTDSGIRDFIYGFFCDVKSNKMALDISFGTIGYSLILSRAFQEVVSLNFHPFYANEEEICRKDEFHINYSTITFREDILSTRRESLRKVDETILTLYRKDRGTEGIKNNLVIVGPFTEEAKSATVNLFLERQQAAQRFDSGCILLTVRPLKIGKRDVTSRFHKLVPQENLFKGPFMDKVKAKLKEDTGDKVKFETVGDSGDSRDSKDSGKSEGIPMKCHNTECVFEILVYKYEGSIIKNKDPPLRPPLRKSPRATSEEGVQKTLPEAPPLPPLTRVTRRKKNAEHEEGNRAEAAERPNEEVLVLVDFES